jgi:hypothetical protein
MAASRQYLINSIRNIFPTTAYVLIFGHKLHFLIGRHIPACNIERLSIDARRFRRDGLALCRESIFMARPA